ncbi:MAG: neutral/alkaline non-lysosomal ceramidase N-terminal domain-containing protein [Anaerolineales bacterium]|nr:MAG: neutral/alkaline non-lysosomal ceramidase N-terminal domain-containing protein [Anaerolineales bacterium]
MTSLNVQAGAAKTDITPDVGCWLEGIPRAQPANAIHDSLHARALVVGYSDGAPGTVNRICLVTCDLIGLSAEFCWQVRERIAQSLETTPAQVVIACTHNHSGPATLGIFHDSERVDKQYLDLLSHRLVQVCQEAAGKAEPALVGVGRGQETTVSQYRRLLARDGRIVMNWEEFPQHEIIGPAEEGDPDLGVVKIVGSTGRTLAVVFNYACHPNSMPGDNFTISADFPGYAADLIEQELGGVALFTNGAQGSVDIEGFEGRDFQGVERRGEALGQAVLDTCRKIVVRPDPVIRSGRLVFLLPYRPIASEALAWARDVVSQAKGEVATLRDGISDEIKAANILQQAGLTQPGVDFEVVGIRLAESIFFAIPGELFTEIGRKIKTLAPSLQIYVIGLANGYHGYIPTAKASAEGGYATDVASGAYLAEQAEDLICENAHILLSRVSKGA